MRWNRSKAVEKDWYQMSKLDSIPPTAWIFATLLVLLIAWAWDRHTATATAPPTEWFRDEVDTVVALLAAILLKVGSGNGKERQ